ncbi:MAG: hypothetical protein L3K23_10680, partial [Thermoplasmata archaeon]|nr:hypothetical protein [Thermoplasmata archaeon]
MVAGSRYQQALTQGSIKGGPAIVIGATGSSGAKYNPVAYPTVGDTTGTDVRGAIIQALLDSRASPYSAALPAPIEFQAGTFNLDVSGVAPVAPFLVSGSQKFTGAGRATKFKFNAPMYAKVTTPATTLPYTLAAPYVYASYVLVGGGDTSATVATSGNTVFPYATPASISPTTATAYFNRTGVPIIIVAHGGTTPSATTTGIQLQTWTAVVDGIFFLRNGDSFTPTFGGSPTFVSGSAGVYQIGVGDTVTPTYPTTAPSMFVGVPFLCFDTDPVNQPTIADFDLNKASNIVSGLDYCLNPNGSFASAGNCAWPESGKHSEMSNIRTEGAGIAWVADFMMDGAEGVQFNTILGGDIVYRVPEGGIFMNACKFNVGNLLAQIVKFNGTTFLDSFTVGPNGASTRGDTLSMANGTPGPTFPMIIEGSPCYFNGASAEPMLFNLLPLNDGSGHNWYIYANFRGSVWNGFGSPSSFIVGGGASKLNLPHMYVAFFGGNAIKSNTTTPLCDTASGTLNVSLFANQYSLSSAMSAATFLATTTQAATLGHPAGLGPMVAVYAHGKTGANNANTSAVSAGWNVA